RPYLGLWRGLEARIERAVYYDLVELALEEAGEADTSLPIWSDGTCFRLDRIEDA
ncbi:DUF1285 family C-terminal domain-containing protein, partial [Blastomonas sp. CCH1-A6]